MVDNATVTFFLPARETRGCQDAEDVKELIYRLVAEKAVRLGYEDAKDGFPGGVAMEIATNRRRRGYEVIAHLNRQWTEEELANVNGAFNRGHVAPSDPFRVAVRRSTYTDLTPKQAARLDAELAKLGKLSRREIEHQDGLDGAQALFVAPSCRRPPSIESSKEEPIWRMIDTAEQRGISTVVVHADGRIIKSWRDAQGRERFWMEK